MTVIDVDFEVFKEITVRRRSEEVSENDVLREVLGLTKTPRTSVSALAAVVNGVSWVSKGVTFPQGTQFRATYKGKQYSGIVKNGALEMNGKRFTSPSAAAVSITGNPVNGWRFWECLLPGNGRWKLAAELRPS